MPIWPEKDSVAVIEGVAIVKCVNNVKIESVVDTQNQTITWKLTGDKEYIDQLEYAWYIHHNQSVIKTLWYDKENKTITFSYSEKGEYFGEVFVLNSVGVSEFVKITDKVKI